MTKEQIQFRIDNSRYTYLGVDEEFTLKKILTALNDNAGGDVLATILDGLDTSTGGVIVDTDTILQAFGKIQYQISHMSSGGGTWGSITGTLSAQTDLQNALDLLQSEINAVNPIGNKLFNYYNFI